MANSPTPPTYESALSRFTAESHPELNGAGAVSIVERPLGIVLQICGDFTLPTQVHQDPDGITALHLSPTRLWLKAAEAYEAQTLELGKAIAKASKSPWTARLEEGQVWLEITGAKSRALMQTALPLDLGVFQQGQSTRTTCAEVGVALVRYTNDAHNHPRYALLIPRSLALHTHEHLTTLSHNHS